jgi:DNA helicase II / ATP-dependent DNA helicase PcrA
MDLSSLNDEQLAAVRHLDGPLLILAGAGSGKTRVITTRAAFLLQCCGVAASRILAVTFTNKAAREMQERITALVGRSRGKGMVIATFHSLCARILREEIEQLGYKKNFSIYGTADQVRLIRDLLQGAGQLEGKADAERVLWLISAAKNRLLSPEELSAEGDGGDPVRMAAAFVYPLYQRSLKAFNAVDFDDLIMLVVRLFREHPAVLARYRERFLYLMVDEYQDTNVAQYKLLRLLADGHRNICVVGDDDQSIYAWRGADLSNILGFEKDFPGAAVIKLERNYRSAGRILAVANGLIRHNLQRTDKILRAVAEDGPRIDYIRCDDEEDEARMVVERIHAQRYQHELAYKDFAILYRTNVQSRAFEEQLRYENIPYVLIGGQQFFDRKEVKDTVAYLRVLVNPLDEVNLLRILNFPRRGIGETTADRLIRASAAQQRPLYEVLRHPGEIEELGEKALAAVTEFIGLLEKYRQRFRLPGRLAETGRELIAELQLDDELCRTADDPKQARRRMDHVEEVMNALASYEDRDESPTLAGFLEKVSLLDRDEPDRGGKDAKLARDAVVLMSLHSSKGLEFSQVFLVGLEEEYLPHRKSIEEGVDVEEERRLCYVGVTRARHRLTLLGAAARRRYGKLQPRVPSRFLEEIPAELLAVQASRERPEAPPEQQEKIAAGFFAGIRALLDD